jgi:hypothetical protein
LVSTGRHHLTDVIRLTASLNARGVEYTWHRTLEGIFITTESGEFYEFNLNGDKKNVV